MHSDTVMREAADHIIAADPAFAPIVAETGLCTIGAPKAPGAAEVSAPPVASTADDSFTDIHTAETHFAALVKSVIAQQLSTRVADTLTARLHRALEGDVSPARVLALDTQLMRDSGLSNAKTRTIRGLAHALHSGDLDLDALVDSGDDDRLRQELTALWGIGRWTAEMFEMFTLHRLDVWPVGDLAMRRGWATLHGMAEGPTARDLDPLGDPLRPYRSVAAWYCWRVVDGDNPSW